MNYQYTRIVLILGIWICTYNTVHAHPSFKNVPDPTSAVEQPSVNEVFELHINCGGGQLTYDGTVFKADQNYSGESKRYQNNSIKDIKNTTRDALYKTERSAQAGADGFGYAIDVPNGIYEVRLHFAEIFWGATGGASGGNGKRNFSVALEEQWLLSNFDIIKEVGSMTAVIKKYSVAVHDGVLDLDLYGNTDHPKISAIELFYKRPVDARDGAPYSYEWKNKAPSPSKKIEPQCVQVGDQLVLIAGFTKGYTILNDTEIYTPATNSWSTGRPIPVAVTHGATALINGELWIVGGFIDDNPGEGTNKVQIYNVATDTWREGPSLPKKRAGGGAVFYNGLLHYYGGFYPDRQTDSGDHFVLNVAAAEKNWKSAPSMPNPRGHFSAALVNGMLYAIGGQHGHDREIVDQKAVHAYNPNTKTWSEKQALPYARSHFEPGTIVYDDQIIIVGGRRGKHYFYNRITAYDPETNTWREIGTLPAEIVGPSSKIFDDQLVITNGGLNGDWNPTDKTWSTSFELKKPTLSIENMEKKSAFVSVYPNPVNTTLYVQLLEDVPAEALRIEVHNILGQKVMAKTVEQMRLDEEQSIDFSTLKNGVYFITVLQGAKENSFKLIKK
ncbi:malectin domain-containing carbohydrate-binding protein [Flavimarina sp. Hel_I_48]|uniref:Kelch repeat-containing protein n=1 Tax=Flavimarina sp. Hel_I_48 TaxID=1392488 RepID=UPI0004DF1B9D|nr:malectin domain-containing carbohydrate-binding protein [Flavimarina sp. Hel_I_48]